MGVGQNLKQREELEGARGLAIIAVIIFHYERSVLPGGYLAVDVFFVMSGYLIFGMLWREYLAKGKIDFAAFWFKRLRRLFPLAATVVLTTILAVYFFGKTSQFLKAGTQAVYALGFVSNYYEIALQRDYFQANDNQSFFQQFWFLAVEVQLYLFVSVAAFMVTYVAFRIKQNPVSAVTTLVLLVIASLISFGINAFDLSQSYSLSYYSPLGRIWQFLAGAIAYLLSSRVKFKPEVMTALAGWALIVIVLTIFSVDKFGVQNQAVAAVATLAASVFMLTKTTGLVFAFLTNSVLRVIGRLSYGLYLWHWPVQQFSQAYIKDVGLSIFVMLAATMLLTMTSYKLIEKPIRTKIIFKTTLPVKLAVFCLVSLGVIAAAEVLKYQGEKASRFASLPGGKPIDIIDFVAALPEVNNNSQNCHLSASEVALAPCLFANVEASETLYLFGDSHALQWFPAIEKVAKMRGYKLVSHTKSSCPPVEIGVVDLQTAIQNADCREWRKNVMRHIALIRPRLVIVSAYSDYTMIKNNVRLQGKANIEAKTASVFDLVKAMQNIAVPMLLIADNVVLERDPIACLIDRESIADCSVQKSKAMADRFPWEFHAPSDNTNIRSVSLSHVLCGATTCKAFDEENLRYRDKSHLAARYTVTLENEFAKFLPP